MSSFAEFTVQFLPDSVAARSIADPMFNVKIAGVHFFVYAVKAGNRFGAFVKAANPTTDMLNMHVSMALLGKTKAEDYSFSHKYKAKRNDSAGKIDWLPWTRLIEEFVVNGKINIQVKLNKIVPPKTLAFTSIMYPDLVLVCEKVEFSVNMCVVAKFSEYIRTAIENKHLWAEEGKLTISHDSASPNVRFYPFQQFSCRFSNWRSSALICMYDGFQPEMKDSAVDLFILSDYLLADGINQLAIDALKTQLAEDTFWKICSAAVMLPNRGELLKACAEYASTPSTQTLFMLMKREDGQAIAKDLSNDMIRVLTSAVADLQSN